MKFKYWIALAALAVVVLAAMIFRPVPIPKETDALTLKGTVADVYDGGSKDIVFKLKGHDQVFYINRGLERGLNIQALKSTLEDEEIVVRYPDYWTPLDFNQTSIHISKIEHKGKTIFSEMD